MTATAVPAFAPPREAVVMAAVRAAHLWSTRATWSDAKADFAELSRMLGVIGLARAATLGEPPQPLDWYLSALAGPLSGLMPRPYQAPGDTDHVVLAYGEVTSEAFDLYAEAAPASAADGRVDQDWDWLRAEQVEHAVFTSLFELEPDVYIAARSALVQQAAAPERELVDTWNRIGWRPPSGCVQPVRARARVGTWCFPCPTCRWPMTFTPARGEVACEFTPHARGGARYRVKVGRGEPSARETGGLPAPTPLRVEGLVTLARPVWRYITVPGLTELELAHKIRNLVGSAAAEEVALWPDRDRVDLRVRAGGLGWEVDVKDWTDADALAAHLRVQQLASPPWIVLPDYRRGHVSRLKKLLPGRKIATVGQFVRGVQRALAGAGR